MRCSVIAVFVFSLESPGEEDDQLQFDILPAIKEKENRNILMICFFLMKISLIWESEIPNCIKCSASLELVPIFSVGTPYRATGGGRDPVVLLRVTSSSSERPRLPLLGSAAPPRTPPPPSPPAAAAAPRRRFPRRPPTSSILRSSAAQMKSWYFIAKD
jgi:hypothetical protein